MRGVVCYCTAFFTHSLISFARYCSPVLCTSLSFYATTSTQPRTPRSPRVLSLDDVVPNPACFNFAAQFIRMLNAVRVLFRSSRSDAKHGQRATLYHAYSVFSYQAQGPTHIHTLNQHSSSSTCLDVNTISGVVMWTSSWLTCWLLEKSGLVTVSEIQTFAAMHFTPSLGPRAFAWYLFNIIFITHPLSLSYVNRIDLFSTLPSPAPSVNVAAEHVIIL